MNVSGLEQSFGPSKVTVGELRLNPDPLVNRDALFKVLQSIGGTAQRRQRTSELGTRAREPCEYRSCLAQPKGLFASMQRFSHMALVGQRDCSH